MAKAKKKKKNGKKLTFKETMKIIWWTMKFNAEISLKHTITLVITEIIRALRHLIEIAYWAVVIDKLVEVAENKGDISQMFNYILGYLALIVIFSINGSIRRFSRDYIRNYTNRSIKRSLYLKTFELGTQSLENPQTRRLLQTAERDMGEIRWFTQEIVLSISELIKVIISSIIVFTISPYVFFSILLILIPMIFVQFKFTKQDWGILKKHRDHLRLTNQISNFLRNTNFLHENTINDIKDIFDRKYWSGQMKFVNEQLKMLKTWNITEFILGNMGVVAILGGYYFLFDKFLTGVISIGRMGFYTSALWNFWASIEYFSFFLSNLQQRAIRFDEIVKFFELETETKEGSLQLGELKIPPKIEIKNLSFKYPRAKETVLDDISITIKPGEKVAIVGHNGAGKTTLIKQVSRTYNLKPKSIFIDGVDLSKYTLKSWYKNIGVLFQDYNFYKALSVEENISIGRSSIKQDKERVVKAAKMADAHEFILEYKKGYQTLMDESFKGGIRPSIGQQQKIAIARFFYRDAPIVIFDEPTAAIDAVAEYKIFNKIYEFFKGKTVIIISHRFSTVRNADMIYVMDKGQIIEKGNHEKLLEIDGTYANAFRLQAEGYQVADKNKDGVVDENEKLEAAQKKES
jgi:ATP-binding cassette, subfamily B, bacterial